MSDIAICADYDCMNVSSVGQTVDLHVLSVQNEVLHALPVENNVCITHELSNACSETVVNSIFFFFFFFIAEKYDDTGKDSVTFGFDMRSESTWDYFAPT